MPYSLHRQSPAPCGSADRKCKQYCCLGVYGSVSPAAAACARGLCRSCTSCAPTMPRPDARSGSAWLRPITLWSGSCSRCKAAIIPTGAHRRCCEGWPICTTWYPTSVAPSMPGSGGWQWQEAASSHALHPEALASPILRRLSSPRESRVAPGAGALRWAGGCAPEGPAQHAV